MIARAGFLFLFLIVIIGIGLYVVPVAELKSGVIVPSGSVLSIHDGNWEGIPFFTMTNGSKLSGSITTSQNVSLYVLPYSPNNSPYSDPFNGTYEVASGKFFSLNESLSKGNYYLVFFALSDTEVRIPPIYIVIERSIVVQS